AHGGSGLDFGLIEAMRSFSPRNTNLELVHRLDRETSGCILLAGRRSALRELHRQFREREVEKHYLALVQGQWPTALKRVDAPLLKTTSEAGERMVKVHRDGQSAVTQFKVLQRFTNATLVQASPVTGRTHQIRVHALHAGHPLFGDDRYGERSANKACRQQGLKRLFLHAASLSFTNMADERITAEAELDQNLQSFLERLGRA
ncbi:MAG: 23S rRNA pseudouridine955/2504/2580 synthase, partial [Halieaceae bacterium]